ncbi:hypothetical protein, partial [Salmonella sp. SAL4448]|uniref:hypothetical protein n=1 Tax=Salmonella sp. SAL4448 TaxID=3159903 RepID=UPI00397A6843
LEAAFDTGSGTPVFQDITSKLSGGSYALTSGDLTALLGAPRVDGGYRLQVRARDSAGNLSVNALLTFTLDTTIATPTAALQNDTANSTD